MSRWDYLCIGHITNDLTSAGRRLGGTAAFAARTAQLLGNRTAVLTSAHPTDPGLPQLASLTVQNKPAAATTTFSNIYNGNARRQLLHTRANPLGPADLPAGWEETAVVHLGPVAAELDPALLRRFPHSIIGLTPQGWMRRWDEKGAIRAADWPGAATVLPQADVVILSVEDFAHTEMIQEYAAYCRLLVLTENAAGCKVFHGGVTRQIPAPAVEVVDPTGAGDIFAAAFLTAYARNGRDPFSAAQTANQLAAFSTTKAGLAAKMDHLAAILPTERRQSTANMNIKSQGQEENAAATSILQKNR